ncbi:hypothetical protein Hypma_014275 [Hypsizygus marmoreus]|uniref:Uncharacterized protein n=1 Tax=Hypsizygus marmoreus TaxID=39966 RepID=A0A369JB58_HYPMA|nr:hypothetical protein Hypma_014275 [Hypsizygus marmoreus]
MYTALAIYNSPSGISGSRVESADGVEEDARHVYSNEISTITLKKLCPLAPRFTPWNVYPRIVRIGAWLKLQKNEGSTSTDLLGEVRFYKFKLTTADRTQKTPSSSRPFNPVILCVVAQQSPPFSESGSGSRAKNSDSGIGVREYFGRPSNRL